MFESGWQAIHVYVKSGWSSSVLKKQQENHQHCNVLITLNLFGSLLKELTGHLMLNNLFN